MRLTALALMIAWHVILCGCHGRPFSSTAYAGDEWRQTIKSATALLRGISKEGNEVPDAILNLTKCVVVFAGSQGKQADRIGATSCREAHDRWEAPIPVSLRTSTKPSIATGDLLLFVIGDQAVRALQSGELQASARNAAPGPTATKASTISGTEINRDLLVYRERSNRLEGVDLSGMIRRAGAAQKNTETTEFLEAVTSYFNSITPVGIIIHHSSTLDSEKVPKGIREVDQFHSKKAFDIICEGRHYHVAYHYLILPDGKVQAGRPERCEGAHAEGYNAYLGISVIGDFSSRTNPQGEHGNTTPTRQQLSSLVTLCRRLTARYKIPLHRIVRHSDVARTECPGDRFPFRQFLAQIE